MANYDIEHIRTLALVGHGGAGKTSLIEALLAKSGAITAPGSVDKGDTVCDYDPLEKAHRHSMKLAVAHLDHAGTRVHLLDTPGYPDFMGQAMCALDAVETVAVVIDAQKGIELTASRMMHWAQTRNLDRMIVVNKIDAPGLDLPGLLANIRAAFGRECLPINLPSAGGADVVDCFFTPSGTADFSSVAEAHQALVDQVVEMDEDLMAVYLEQGEVRPEQLHAPFEQALREGHLVPVCFVSAQTGAGVAAFLDIMVKLLPNPAEGNRPMFVRGEGEAAEPFRSEPDPDKHVIGHVFKVEIDPYVGKIGVFRVHQGVVSPGSQLYIGDSRKPFKVSHLFMLQGKQLTEVEACGPGDICAVSKIDDLDFDAVLHDAPDDDHIHMEPLDFPYAVFGLAVRARKQSDASKLTEVLHKLAAEDLGLHVEHDATTHEIVIRGLGELHLANVLEKMREQFHLDVDSHPPAIPYRETILTPAEGHHRHKKQSGGAGQFGEVYLRVEPMARGQGFEFIDAVKGGVIPGAFIPAVEKGVRQAMNLGAVAGFPLQDVRVTVYDGKNHPVDGKEVAFVAAGKKAFLEAMSKARPIVLEPIVNIELTIPESHFGDVSGEMSGRRGQITGSQAGRGGMMVIGGQAPLAELDNFQQRLKALTGGQGSYTLEMSHYQQVPVDVQQQLAAGFRPHPDED
ncbi:MAG: elongation factor G [Hydrogenophilales bacterium CG03_land_8_20_14_0_80_62_28]|nr:elongation factor G [Betaproteobacteria bacterium]OIO78594.1 MAG: elongation factor G [Hydrogenophilaceae bacterium CG1_02_62_390]PIV22727.1 MAG: elongation factor G [Hydrogenophilales bacterium CG03_land_8_20_14_0_80_62_28]PIW72859.1 MAG: elongation factor G [Hydrogenophilales bacterium CG12_big_fil_rev_8_21_14_0_65_61_21]PIX01359.1 MAG: elongation factor G [Hydrogenophilales bacterium CG_4_8_14_3_um_filter_62_83]PIY99480.1 MAG: elongation factor G [Hydrogenophilales bacterium CG_4_10_14_0